MKRNSPLPANLAKGSLKIVIKDEPFKALFPFVVVFSIACSWTVLAPVLLLQIFLFFAGLGSKDSVSDLLLSFSSSLSLLLTSVGCEELAPKNKRMSIVHKILIRNC